MRALERTILTSVLYTMPARGVADAPPWTSGPRKLLAAEPWLDTVGGVVGERLGSCDHRFVSQVASYEAYVDPALLKGAEKSTLIDQKKLFDYGRRRAHDRRLRARAQTAHTQHGSRASRA